MFRYHLSHQFKFVLVGTTERSQAGTMTLAPGDSEGGPDNRHSASDQWLFVISGEGRAVVEGKRVDLTPGTLLLIEAGEWHEIINTGTKPLETLDFYAPPEKF